MELLIETLEGLQDESQCAARGCTDCLRGPLLQKGAETRETRTQFH